MARSAGETDRVKLTKREIDSAKYRGNGTAKCILYDRELSGFGLRIYPSGEKSFILRYRNAAGRERQLTLGKYGVLTLAQARDRAKRELLKVGTGTDPLEDRQEARRGATVREFASVYIERHSKPHNKTWKEEQRRCNLHILPTLGSRRVDAVRRADIAALHSKLGERTPVEANRVLALISVMFNKAVEWGYLDDELPNPAKRVMRFKERKRDRWVEEPEMRQLIDAMNAEENPFLRALFWLYLLTGMRRGELREAKWTDINWDRKEIRLPDTKSGRPHYLPLSAPALRILEDLPRLDENPYIFPGQIQGRPYMNLATPWERVRTRFWLSRHPEEAAVLRVRAAEEIRRRSKHAVHSDDAVELRLMSLASEEAKRADDLRLHDLRRTVGSWLATDGASLPLIGKVLNHTSPSTTQIYARLGEHPTRVALERHGERLVQVAMGKKLRKTGQ